MNNTAVMRHMLGLLFTLCLLAGLNIASAGESINREQSYHFRTYTFIESAENDWRSIVRRLPSEGEMGVGPIAPQQPIWLHFIFDTGEEIPLDWLFDIGDNFGGVVSFYLIRNGELVSEYQINSYESFNQRPYEHRKVLFPLRLPTSANMEILVKIDEHWPLARFRFSLHPKHLYIEEDGLKLLLIGLLLGLIAALAIYHFFLAGATFERIYLIYSIYISAGLYNVLFIEGVGFQLLWPNLPFIQYGLGGFAGPMLAILASVFTIHFLKLATLSKKITYYFYGLIASLIVVELLTHLKIAMFARSLIPLFAITIYLSFIGVAIYALKRNIVYARYFLIAWTIYCVCASIYLLSVFGFITLIIDRESARIITRFAFLAQVNLLALALAHRIRTLRSEKMEAETDSRAKSAFLARMSHEVRTPLSGILGVAELMADRLKDKTNIHYNNIIRSCGKSLLTIINDILDYSKFHSGNMNLEKFPFDIRSLATDSLDLFEAKASEKQIALIADIDPEIPEHLEGDPTRIKQIMINLISNAIKFTERGRIELAVHYAEKNDQKVQIKVSDSGIGISKDEQQHLFEAFSQANTDTARKYGGTGLGLSICKELAVLMGGEIGVESEKGVGTSFWVVVKLPTSNADKRRLACELVNLAGRRILIAEDNSEFAESLLTQVANWGMEATVANNGRQALEILELCHEEGLTFDIISLDLFMPVMDGLETGRQIQQDERFKAIPRLLLTSATDIPNSEQLRAAGICAALEKPSLPSRLKEIYCQILESQHQQTAAESTNPAGGPTIPTLKILVAEDNPVNQTVIRGILKRLKQSPEVVNDGKDAVERITRDGMHYDLILMDCEMQEVDGVSATRQIRKWEQENHAHHTPIIALTAHVLKDQVDMCYEAGMDGFLSKPIEIPRLEGLLMTHTSRGETSTQQSLH